MSWWSFREVIGIHQDCQPDIFTVGIYDYSSTSGIRHCRKFALDQKSSISPCHPKFPEKSREKSIIEKKTTEGTITG
jgi:hypothetical protein